MSRELRSFPAIRAFETAARHHSFPDAGDKRNALYVTAGRSLYQIVLVRDGYQLPAK